MIVPVLNFILSFRLVPMTWILLSANLVLFFLTALPHERGQQRLEKIYRQHGHLRTQGEIFAQFIRQNPDGFSSFARQLAERGRSGHERALTMLGQLAVRHRDFPKAIAQTPEPMDPVAQKRWLANYQEAEKAQVIHPSYILGLTQEDSRWSKWFSYQFIHSGLAHLLGNMFFLLLFGSILEPVVGGVVVFLTYLLSGLAGAGFFLWSAGSTAAPLVGASGAVSGLMGLFAVLFWGKRVRFFYWLLPMHSYMGFVFLPGWIVLALWLLSDLAGLMAGIPEIGGVAHMAHLGGMAQGLFIGGILRHFSNRKASGAPSSNRSAGGPR